MSAMRVAPAATNAAKVGGPTRARSWLFLAAHDPAHPHATGGDLLAFDLAEALAGRGDDVEIWCSRHRKLPTKATLRGVKVRRFPPGRMLPLTIRGALLVGRGRRFHVIVEQVVGTQRFPFLARLFSSKPTLGIWYQDNVPLFDAVFRGSVTRWLARALQRVLLVVYAKGPVLTCSQTSSRWLAAQGIPSERIGLFYPRVNLPPGAKAPPPFVARENLFVVIGNFRPTKRFEEALEVLREVRRRGVDARCAIVGRTNDLPYLERIRALAEAPDLRGSVDLLPDLGEEEKFALLLRAKVLTVHSPIEGFGWTLLEAGRQGVPAVVNSGVPEEARGSEGGTQVVPFGDVGAYADAVAGWMTSAPRWTDASSATRQHAAMFAGSVLTSELLEFLARTFP